MELSEFLKRLNNGEYIAGGSEMHLFMHNVSQSAIKICSEINSGYHTPEEIRQLMSELTGREIDEGFGLFPPFFSDCGKNIHIGRKVFINSGCKLQDQGGIFIGDGVLIGHNVVISTLNHDLHPEKRQGMHPKSVKIGRNVWIGSNSTILPGVTVGDNAVIGAGSVVTRDVPENMVVAGNPAKVIKSIFEGNV
ncbi:MAG: sugar O-acetyltransferase [Ruminococcus sp.]|nr:sugar O-acetyltransferase [Ruminococcus sp.]